ncbi:MAG: GGDEF domain-containing protein [Gammaproteobacteria bacterium]|nr:GGDEF domain-containing protein [Gammaproteobacteria bacterium]MBT4196096.1 GGDEF domain-containing protein [Gammaproteobacteria bacterium]MBT4451788.1 GGDEF domain-containing protein [Gammaproteobacteria bacterium]MBT7044913.1 GGDEF domain-containing protein [Gammaproteobacteria bacterium]MBT7206435.1 GGDEF domain-containing protein [Gammaproteobacteria bacterium]
MIERSLLQTLVDFAPSSEYRLYRVLSHEQEIGLALTAYAKNNIIDTLEHEIKDVKLPDVFHRSILTAIEKQSIQIINDPKADDQTHLIYPAKDKNNENYSVLIQSNRELNFDDQRLIHALLKVYSNYLELIDKTRRDKLTQLLNRETLDAEITRLLMRNNTPESNFLKLPEYSQTDARQPLKNSTYWLTLIDIDFFKNINDTYGHLYGDEVLILVARLLEESIREYDLAFRYGGEEFVIIAVSDQLDTAIQAFERIRKVVNEHPFANVEGLSISIGFTQVTDQMSPSDVIGEADSALYYAKNNGRNQVQFYDELVDKGLIDKKSEEDIESGGIDFF